VLNKQDHVLHELERIVAAMDASGETCELIAIDDGSTQRHHQGSSAGGWPFPPLRVISFGRNGGSGT
jgi:polyisoprenyl-phosphate glycosyltransferase